MRRRYDNWQSLTLNARKGLAVRQENYSDHATKRVKRSHNETQLFEIHANKLLPFSAKKNILTIFSTSQNDLFYRKSYFYPYE